MRAVKIIEGILQLRSLETWPSPSSLADPAIDTSSSPMSVPVGVGYTTLQGKPIRTVYELTRCNNILQAAHVTYTLSASSFATRLAPFVK